MTEPLLQSQLDPVVRRQRKWRRMRSLAICWAAAALLGYLFLLGRPYLGDTFRLALPLLVGVTLVATIIIWRRIGRWQPDYRSIARQIEQKHPELHALLLTAVEQQPDPETGKLNFLQERVIAEAVAQSRRHQWIDSVSFGRLFSTRLAQLTALGLLVWVALQLQMAPPVHGSRGSAASRGVTVTPGDAKVERGSGLVILARFTGPVPAEATLVIGTNPETSKRLPLTRTLADPVFGGSIPEVGSNLVYHVEFGTERTRDFNVTVFEYPALQRSDARIVYPEYTGVPEKRIEETRRVSAVEGSQLDFTLQLNKPVAGARFVGKDKSIVKLTVETNKPLAMLKDFALMTNGTYELQLIDSEGRTNKIHSQFVFEALKNRTPELKLLAPRGDQRVSPLEEMTFSGEAWDDFGLRDYGMTYTVAGSKPVVLSLGTNAAANEKRKLGHLLELEELSAQPDQLISWFLWADDIGPDGKVRRSSSDMFFAEVRPFEEIFRESQGQEGESPQGEGSGNETTKLAELQKQIINATWKLQRSEIGKEPSAQYKKDAPVVLESQEKALEQAEALQERVTDPRLQPLVEKVVKEMEEAAANLKDATKSTEPLPLAIASEQEAYQALLKLSAREYLVSRNRNRSQGGGGGQANQKQLEQLDMKQKEDRYETQSQATPQQNAEQREQLQVLNRLKELAQRQQDLNERMKELQSALQEVKTDEEREEIKRRLKRLREEQQEMLADVDELRQRMDKPENQSKMAEARQQLDKTRSEVQKAAESLEKESASQALASGTRAQSDLQKLRDDFRKANASQFTEEMKQMRNEARQLADKQEQIGKEMESLGDNKRKTLTDSGKSKELAEQLDQQRGSLTNLLENLRGVSDKAEAVEPLLARQLYETLRKSSQGQADNSLNMSGELLKRSFTAEANQFEQKARGEINDLKQGVEKAAESVLGDDVESLRLAKRELDELTRQIENEMAQAQGQGQSSQSQTNGNQRAGGSQPGGQQAQTGTTNFQIGASSQQGQQGQQQGQSQEQQPGQGQQAQQGQGQGQQQAQLGQQGQQPGQQPGQGQDGQQGQGQQSQQAQQGQGQGQGQQQGQQGQQPGQQPGQGQGQQQGQQAQQGQGQGQGQQQAQQGQQPGQGQGQGQQQGQGQGQGQAQQQAQQGQPGQPGPQGANNRGAGGGGERTRNLGQRPFFDSGGPGGDDRGEETSGPLTGEQYTNWSDRLRDVEEMIDVPDLRNEVARVRDRARAMRLELKRHGKNPQWPLVKAEISGPLAEVRSRVAEELARREKSDSLVPIDRDPVPGKYSDLVRRYYEKLGNEEQPQPR